jgi:hypothetical protein
MTASFLPQVADASAGTAAAPPLPQFPNTDVKAWPGWSNFHGTVKQPVPIYCTPNALPQD